MGKQFFMYYIFEVEKMSIIREQCGSALKWLEVKLVRRQHGFIATNLAAVLLVCDCLQS